MLLLGAGCASVEGEPAPTARTLSISPAAGAPGTPITVSLSPSDGLPERLTLEIAGARVPAVRVDAGWQAVVPFIAGPDGWHAPTDGPVDVTAFADDEAIATAEGSLQIEALARAPGASASLVASTATVAAAARRIMALDVPRDQPEAAYAYAVQATVDFIFEDESYGIEANLARLAEQDPEAFARLEAMLQSSGLLERQAALARAMATWEASAPPFMGVAEEIDDARLAWRLQFYVVAHGFVSQVVHDTAVTFGLVMAAAGFVDLAGAALPAAVISAGVALLDFVLAKVWLSTLPAALDSFELEAASNTIAPRQVLDAEVVAIASNVPGDITWNDAVGLLLAALGVASSTGGAAEGVQDAIDDFVNATWGFAQAALATYADSEPDLIELDFTLTSMPALSWRANVTDPRLAIFESSDEAVLETVSDPILGWRSRQIRGTSTIRAVTRGREAALLPDVPGFEYGGGAFGEASFDTGRHEIVVATPIVLEVDFAAQIAEGGINALSVRAGHEDDEGDPVWEAGLQVALSITGGTIDVTSGVTDADGELTALVQLSPGSERVEVQVTVTDADGVAASRTVSASTTPTGTVTIDSWIQEAEGVATISAPGLDPDSDFFRQSWRGPSDPPSPLSGQASASLSAPDPGVQASARASAQSDLTISDEQLPTLVLSANLDAQASMTLDASIPSLNRPSYAATGEPGASSSVRFTVVDGPVAYAAAGSTSSTDNTQARVALLFGRDKLMEVDAEGGESKPVAVQGVLEPGTYDLVIRVSGLAYAQGVDQGTDTAAAAGDVTFTLSPAP